MQVVRTCSIQVPALHIKFYILRLLILNNLLPFSARITAAKIRLQPKNIFSVKASCRKIVLKRIPNTDSKLNKSEARED